MRLRSAVRYTAPRRQAKAPCARVQREGGWGGACASVLGVYGRRSHMIVGTRVPCRLACHAMVAGTCTCSGAWNSTSFTSHSTTYSYLHSARRRAKAAAPRQSSACARLRACPGLFARMASAAQTPKAARRGERDADALRAVLPQPRLLHVDAALVREPASANRKREKRGTRGPFRNGEEVITGANAGFSAYSDPRTAT